MTTESTNVEREDAIDIVTDLAPSGWSMKDVDPARELEKFNAAAELQTRLVTASIKATKPQDWVIMGKGAYLQGTGVERIAPLWGLVFGEPKISKLDLGEGAYAYVVVGPIGSRRTGVFYQAIEGGRQSDDPFFDRFDEDKPDGFYDLSGEEQRAWRRAHRIKPDELDVRKAAVTNWQTRGASMLTGLRGLTQADLAAAGMTAGRTVDYAGGTQGGAAPDLAQGKTDLWNDIQKRTGGDVEASRQLLKDITSFTKDGKTFPGYNDHQSIKSAGMLSAAKKKLLEHPTFGDKKAGA